MVQKQFVCRQSYIWNNFAFVPCAAKQQSKLLVLKINILPPVANFSAIFFPLCNRHLSLLFPSEGCCLQFPILFTDQRRKMKHQHFRTYSGEDSTCRCRRCNKRCGFDPWVGKIRWRRNGHPLQVFFLEKSMDRGAFWATVHGVTNSQTRLNN